MQIFYGGQNIESLVKIIYKDLFLDGRKPVKGFSRHILSALCECYNELYHKMPKDREHNYPELIIY